MTQNISEPTTGEYEAINFDGLERRANYRTIAYREDILHILERKDAAAILYQIIYRWETEIKRPLILKEIERRKQSKQSPLTFQEVEDMMWVYMSYNDFVRESGGAVAYNTVIRMLDYMIDTKKVVEQRPNHDPRYPDYEYRINRSVVKELLKALPAEPIFTPKVPKKKEKSTQEGIGSDGSTQEGTPPQSSTQMGTESTQEGIATTQMGTEVYPNGGTSHITTHNYSHNYSTEDESIPATESDTPTVSPPVVGDSRASSPLEEFFSSLPIPVTFDDALVYLAPHGGVPPGLDAVEVMNLAQKLWSEAHEDEWEQRATWRALQTGLIESGVLPQSDDEEDITQAETVKVPVVPKQNTPTPTPAQATSPQSEQVAPGQALPKQGKGKKQAESEPKCDTREIQRCINAHRGYALEERVELIRERQAVKTWCNLHELEEYDRVMQGLKHDPYWSKPENYYRIGGLTLLKETSRILAMAATQYKPALRIVPASEQPTVSGRPRLDVPPEYLAM